MVNFKLKRPYFYSSYCFLAAKLQAFIISYFIENWFVDLSFLQILVVVWLSAAIWTARVRFILNCFMTATASNIAASFLGRNEMINFTLFSLWCGARRGCVIRKLLITCGPWDRVSSFSGHKLPRVWAVHCVVMLYSKSSSGETTMTMYGGCTLIADACFA